MSCLLCGEVREKAVWSSKDEGAYVCVVCRDMAQMGRANIDMAARVIATNADLKERVRELEAQAAAMREALVKARSYISWSACPSGWIFKYINEALSSDAGRDLLAERDKYKAALERARQDVARLFGAPELWIEGAFNYIDEALKQEGGE